MWSPSTEQSPCLSYHVILSNEKIYFNALSESAYSIERGHILSNKNTIYRIRIFHPKENENRIYRMKVYLTT